MQIETERLVLRKPRLDDVDDFLEFAGDDEVMRWIAGVAGDRAATVELLERWIARWERDDVGQFVVLLDGHAIGRVGLLVWNTSTWETSSYAEAAEHAQPELGWAFTRRFWGHGYATEAARAAREWAYADRAVERLISLIAPDNARSIRVAEKLGATREQTISTFHGPANVWMYPR
jgi:RimJ/RimL family protein N-acetyltransferase